MACGGQAGVGQHHVGAASRQPGRDRNGGVTGHRDRAVRAGQVVQRIGEDNAFAFQEHAAATAVDRGPKPPDAQVRQSVGQRLADRHAHHRDAGTECNPVRQREACPDAGKAAGADGDGDQIEGGGSDAGLAQDRVGHHRQQRGVTLRRGLLADGPQGAVQHDAGGALCQSGIEGEHKHVVQM